MDKANKAAMQFKEKVGKRLPIVIVDEDKCLKTEKILLQEMVQKFKEAPSEELYLEIKQKIRNNQQTDRKFGQDIDIGDEPKQVEKESIKDSVEMYELKQAYDEISDVERNDFVLNFKKMYFELSSIREDEKERE